MKLKHPAMFLTLAVWLAVLAACGGAGSSSATAGKKVMFVGRGDGNIGDALLVNRIKNELKLEVVQQDDKGVAFMKTPSASEYALIYISESSDSKKISNAFANVPIPVIYSESGLLDDASLAESAGHAEGAQAVEIRDGKHPLAAGLQNRIDVYKMGGKIGYATPSQEAAVIATLPGEPAKAAIFAYEKGAKNLKGEPVPARQVYFFLLSGEQGNLTENGWKLFDAAVRWAIGAK